MPVLAPFQDSSPAASKYSPISNGDSGVTSAAVPENVQDELSRRMFNQSYSSNVGVGAVEMTARTLAGVGVDLVDTVWGNGLNPMGDRGDVWSLFEGTDQKAFYDRNKGLIEGGSAIVGSVATGYIGGALVLPRLGAALAESSFLTSTRAWQAGARFNEATREGMMLSMRNAAANGQAYNALKVNVHGGAGLARYGYEMAKGAGVGLAEEALIYGVMNANKAAYTDDMSNNLMWAAMGPAVGATIFGVAARADARMYANSAEMVNIRKTTLDSAGASNDYLKPVLDRSVTYTGSTTLKDTSKSTQLAIISRSKGLDDSRVGGRVDDIRAEAKKANLLELSKIQARGIEGVQTVRGDAKSMPEWHNLQRLQEDDVAILHGISDIGVPSESIKVSLKAREELIKLKREQAGVLQMKRGNQKQAKKLIEEAKAMENQEAYVLLNRQFMWSGSDEAERVSRFRPENVAMTIREDTTMVSVPNRSNNPIWVGEGFNIGGRTPFNELDVTDRLKVVEATRTVMEMMIRKKKIHVISKKSVDKGDWFALDSAIEYGKRAGADKVDLSKSGFKDMAEVQLASLKMKAKAMEAKFGLNKPIDDWDRLAFNMPSGTTMERLEDSAGDLFRTWMQAVSQVDPAAKGATQTLKELEDALMNTRVIAGLDLLPKGGGRNIPTNGDIFNWNRDSSGKWLRPMLAFQENRSSIQPITAQSLAEAGAIRKLNVLSELTKNTSQFISSVAVELAASPYSKQAMDVIGLSADQVTGLGNKLTQLLGEPLTRRFRARDNKVVLAATQVAEKVQRRSNLEVKRLMEKFGMSDDLTKYYQSNRKAQKAMINQFASNRAGWDLELDLEPVGKDLFAFKLSDTPKNRARLGVEEVTDEVLTNHRTGSSIVVDSEVAMTLKRMDLMTKEILINDNAIRRARGLKEIEPMNFYVAPPNIKNARVAFLFDEMGNVQHNRTIIATTQEEFDRLVEKTMKDVSDEAGAGHGWYVREKSSLDSISTSWDEAQMDWQDPFFTGRKDLQQNGGLAGAYVREDAFKDQLDWTRRKVINQGNETVRAMFDESIQVARMHSVAERNANGNVNKANVRTVFDEWESALLGTSLAYSKSSVTGPIFSGIESAIDNILATNAHRVPGRLVVDLGTRLGVPMDSLNRARSYEQISKAMGPYTPYKSAVDYAEQSLKVKQPLEVRKIADKLNHFAATAMLRWLEIPQAAMNLIGVMATMPALARTGRAPITAGFTLSDNTKLGIVDSMRIMVDATSEMFTRKSVRAWEVMAINGDSTQQVADFHRALSSIQDQNSFNRVMFGTGNEARDGLIKGKGIDGLLSVATDKTENWSRSWAHHVGLRLADYHNIRGETAQHDFAREIANAVIADYAPVNRPELFQTAFGSMFGLFMSYMMNQNMKMFRWMEQKEYGALGINLAMQASMFGVTGVPGVKQAMAVSDWWNETGKNEPTALDRIYAQFGPSVGSMIAHGGFTATGMALYTRGDMSLRAPAFLDWSQGMPAVSVMLDAAKAVNTGIQAALSFYEPAAGQRLLEGLSRDVPNRMLKGWLALANGGQEVDAYGNLVSETKTWVDTMARVIGLRSVRQQAEVNQFYASKSAMDKDAARMDKVRSKLRSQVRMLEKNPDQQLDVVPLFEEFTKAGGNPRLFRSWVKSAMRDATDTRAMKALRRDLSNPTNQLAAWRFAAYGADVE